MVVRRDRGGVIRDDQTARHAEVQDQRPAAAIDEQILAPTRERLDSGAGHGAGQQPRDAETQGTLADDRSPNALTDQQSLETAARRLDFGELRHANSSDQ